MDRRQVTLVLLPGMDGTGVLFRPLLAALPSHVRPVVVTFPGDRAGGYQEHLELVLAALPKGEPFLMLGESFSGPLALLAAARRPPGLVGVILCVSFVRNPVPYIPSALAFLARAPLFAMVPLFASSKALVGGYSSPALRGLLSEAYRLVRPATLAARARAILRVDVTRELTDCATRILYIRGSRDRVVPAWNLARIKRQRPDTRVAVVEGPHLLLQTAPQGCSDAIVAFADSRGKAI